MKNLLLQYKEKIKSISLRHLLRFARMLVVSPRASIANGVNKVMVNLTYRCECSCDYCWCIKYEKEREKELSLAEIKQLLDQIAESPSLFTLVSFIGGEPLLREELFEMIRYASRKGLFVEMETNGVRLSQACVGELKNSGLDHIFVRVEGSDAARHDTLSLCPGCFDLAIEGIKECLRSGLSCSIFANASKEKVRSGELQKIIALARGLGVNSVRLIYPTLSGGWIGSEKERLNKEEEKAVASLLEPGFVYLESSESCTRGSSRSCAALQRKFFHVSCHGEIQPCPFVPLSFGNIREEPLTAITKRMFSHPLFEKRYKGCLMNDAAFRREYILGAGLEASYKNISLSGSPQAHKRSGPRRLPVPGKVFFTLTRECNLSCKTCYNEKGGSPDLASEETVKKVIDRIKESGAGEVVLTGGEPFLYPGILGVIDHIISSGMRLRINTNGLLLTEGLIEEIARREAVTLTLGIDGVSAETHDFIRGEGSFRRAVEVLEKLSHKGIRLYVNFTATRRNFNELFRLSGFLKKFKVSQAIINIFLGCGSGHGHRDIFSLTWKQRFILHIPGIFALSGPGTVMRVITSCYAGRSEANIDYRGEFFFCELLKMPLGNVLERSIRDIWWSPELTGLMDASSFGSPCNRCFFRKGCGGGCRAEVFSETGDIRSGNPRCIKGRLIDKLSRINH